MRAVVVGAGVAGLTAGLALREAGVEVVVLERAGEPKLVGTGLHLWTNALLALRRVGAEDAVRAAGVDLERSVFMTSKGRVLVDWPVGEVSRRLGAPTLGVLRPDLGRALLDAGGAALTRYGTTCTRFEQDDDGVTAQLQGQPAERADVLVGADGVDSAIRAQLLGPAPARYSGYAGWRAVIDWDDEPVARFRTYAGRGCRFTCYPVAPGRLYWLATARVPAGGKDDPASLKDTLDQRYAGFADPVPAVIRATPLGAILRSDIVDRDPVDRWGEGRVTLIGDAAHPMTPNLAMGACTAVEDGIVLARHLAGEATPSTALRAYERERMKRTAPLTEQSRMLGRAGHWSNPAVCAVRDAVMSVALRTVGMRRTARMMEFAG